MGPLKYQVTGTINALAFFSGITAPKQKHHILPFPVNDLNNPVSKGFPAHSLMRASLPLNHSEHTVQQQHTLLCPRLKTAMIWARNAKICLNFLEDINQ